MDDKTWCFKQATIDLIEEATEWIKLKKEDLKGEELLLNGSTSDRKGGIARICFGQLNCGKSQRTLELLTKRMDPEGSSLDILLLSEPPVDINKGSIKCSVGDARIYHYRPENRCEKYHFWAAIIVLNSSLEVKFKPSWADPFLVSIRVKVEDRKELKVISVYNRVEAPEAAVKIESMLLKWNTSTVVGGDFNVHLKKWNRGQRTHKKEEESLLDAMNGPQWKIINTPNSITWESKRNLKNIKSTIDYSLVSKDLENRAFDWNSIKIQELDHRLLTFVIAYTNTTPLPEVYPPSNASIIRKISQGMEEVKSFRMLMQSIRRAKEELGNRPSSRSRMLINSELTGKLRKVKKEVKRLEVKRKNGMFIKTVERDLRRLRRKEKELRENVEEEITVKLNEVLKQEIRKNPWKKAPIGKHTPTQLCIIEKDGIMVSDRKEMAELIMNDLHKDQPKQESSWDNCNILLCPEALPLERQEFLEAVNSLKNNKASGLDGCSIKLVKLIIAKWPDMLYNWYKRLYQEGDIPEEWKNTKLVAVAKNKHKHPKVEDFRPIGISSAWAKIYEKIEVERINFWAKKEKILMKCQSGFIKGSSPKDAWDNINTFLYKRNEKGLITRKLIVKIDVKGAFDNVRPEDILDALVEYKYPAQSISNIAKYIMNRTNTLVLGEHSTCRPKYKGTVQGAIFSPIFFNILMAHKLKNYEKYVKELTMNRGLDFLMSIYADDIIIILERTEDGDWYNDGINLLNSMTLIIESMEKNLKDLGLAVSKEKTQAIFWPNNAFSTRYDDTMNEMERGFHITSTIKILGINITPGKSSNKGAFDDHVLGKIAEGKRILLSLKNNRKGSMKWKRMMIQSVVLQVVFYGSNFWSQSITDGTLDKLESFLWKCNRFVADLDKHVPQKATTIITGLPPAHLELQKTIHMDLMEKAGLLRDGKWIPPPPAKAALERFHPANFPSFEYEGDFHLEADIPPCTHKEAHIYTDATLSEESGGMAAVNYNQGKFILYKTTRWTNPFELETMIIFLALKELHSLIAPDTERVVFLTDSKATVQALKNRKNDHHTVNGIRRLIESHNSNGHRSLAIAWVKGHRDISGNQAADLMAMVASKIGKPIAIPCTKGLIKKVAREELQKEWDMWYKRGKDESLKKFFPSLDLAQLHLKDKEAVLFFSSSLEWMNSYAAKLKSRGRKMDNRGSNFEDGTCECEDETIQDAWHLIFHCPFLDDERKGLMKCQSLDPLDIKGWCEGTKEKDKNFYYFILSLMPNVKPKLETARKVLCWLKSHEK